MELIIEHLTKTYPNGVQALQDVNLKITAGMYGLLGPNGAGKSTLMRTIATLQEADSGSIQLGNLNVLQQKNEVRKILGYLPQEFGVYPKITAEAMLDHIASLKGVTNRSERKDLVQRLLERVNLGDVRKKQLGTFSGGMKQRFGIAQALIGNPKLIIVDEPTAGLDPAERNRFHNLLSEIGANTIVILSTHIVDDVANLCKNMAIICKGQVIAEGHPAELTAKAQGHIWRKVIDKSTIEQYREQYRVINTTLLEGQTEIHIYQDEAPSEAGFTPAVATLEDVYFSKIAEYMDVVTI
ncbi:MAG: ABC transporter ATP-binding protein [Lewinellaceae bacterium]|nr:ABC transporter ATP-binding protein [Lewinellaceae bacterium]